MVESDAAIRSLITIVLRREGFDVDALAGPDSALARLQEREYAVVVLDLPHDDPRALPVLEHLQQRAPRTLRRIVIVTTNVNVLRHGLPANVCRVLAKPFEIDALVAAVETCAAADG